MMFSSLVHLSLPLPNNCMTLSLLMRGLGRIVLLCINMNLYFYTVYVFERKIESANQLLVIIYKPVTGGTCGALCYAPVLDAITSLYGVVHKSRAWKLGTPLYNYKKKLCLNAFQAIIFQQLGGAQKQHETAILVPIRERVVKKRSQLSCTAQDTIYYT